MFLFFFLLLNGLWALAHDAKYLSFRLPVLFRGCVLPGDEDDLEDEKSREIEEVVKERAKEGHLDACGRVSTIEMRLMYRRAIVSVRGSTKWDQISMVSEKDINGNIIRIDHKTSPLQKYF